MNISVIGTGNIGSAVARAVARAGHSVQLGSREPRGRAATGGDELAAAVTSVPDAIAAADLVVLAVPGNAVADFAAEHGSALAGKLLVDATNRLGGAGPFHSAAAFAAHAPRARYARAFNTLGWENLAEPDFGGVAADLFYSCAADDRPPLEELITAVGLRPVYLGEDQHDLLDGVLRVWFALAVGQGHGRHLAFKTLHD